MTIKHNFQIIFFAWKRKKREWGEGDLHVMLYGHLSTPNIFLTARYFMVYFNNWPFQIIYHFISFFLALFCWFPSSELLMWSYFSIPYILYGHSLYDISGDRLWLAWYLGYICVCMNIILETRPLSTTSFYSNLFHA